MNPRGGIPTARAARLVAPKSPPALDRDSFPNFGLEETPRGKDPRPSTQDAAFHRGNLPMHDPRPRPSAGDRSNPSASIPDSQNRALDRRHSLAEQQRAYQGPYPPPYLTRRRPPA